LVASVACLPEKYATDLLPLGLDIIERKPTPTAVFIKHQLVAPHNVDHFYPNGGLLV
jgi:hypothetical protein